VLLWRGWKVAGRQGVWRRPARTRPTGLMFGPVRRAEVARSPCLATTSPLARTSE
jgi:hypothetical protein